MVGRHRDRGDRDPLGGRRRGLLRLRKPTGASCSPAATVDSIASNGALDDSDRRECMLWGRNAMATGGVSAKKLSAAEHNAQLRRAIVASTVGSGTASDDWLVYRLIAPLVFAKLYFPSS